MSRALSTAVDAVVFLLLVSAAVAVVGTPTEQPATVAADETAAVLATSTATVVYTPAGADRSRRAHGTYAGLLAGAAVANATLDDRAVSPAPAFVDGVRRRTATVVGARTQVSARWTPYPGAPLVGTVVVGPEPPPTADVHVETVRVPVSVPAASIEPGADPGEAGAAIAGAVTAGLLPADPTALPRTGVSRQSLRRRSRILAGGNRSAGTPTAGVSRAGVRATLERRFSADLRADGVPAAEATKTGTATVVVRRWET